MRALVIALTLSLLSIACKQSAPSAPPVPPTFDERQGCGADDDCAVVELACCDHCNGGTVVGVHKDHAADVRKEYAPAAECRDTACTEMACSPAVPICRQGRCGVSRDGQESLPELLPP